MSRPSRPGKSHGLKLVFVTPANHRICPVVHVRDCTNREFFETHVQPGRVGLVGGVTLLEKAIKRAERHVTPAKRPSLWSHAMLFEGRRADGQQWVIESDLEIHEKHFHLGVQETRLAKYFKEQAYPDLAVLDFGLTERQVTQLLGEALEMVASRSIYSLTELLGTAVALRNPWFRGRKNLLARKKSMYCSGFVQYVFLKAGIDLTPGVHASHGTPEDISRTPVPHVTYLLQRTVA